MVLSLMIFMLKQKLLNKWAMSLLILNGCGIGYLSFMEKLINTYLKLRIIAQSLKDILLIWQMLMMNLFFIPLMSLKLLLEKKLILLDIFASLF